MLRVRLSGPDQHRAQARWALEAILERAHVSAWEFIDDAAAHVDMEWGPADPSQTTIALPASQEQWRFEWDSQPEQERDPLAFTFWWLARVEELLAPPRAFDHHGRFRYACSQLARSGDPLAAPVDDLARSLAGRLGDWCDAHAVDQPAFRIVATHDIDLPLRWTRAGRRRALRSIRTHLRSRRVMHAARELAGLATSRLGRDPWDNFEQLTALERSNGARSTSYLLVGAHAPEDGDREAIDRGARWSRGVGDDRIGLHGSYTSSEDPAILAAERDLLLDRFDRREPLDHRFHYLRHRPVEAWPLLEQLQMRSDASLGYAEQPGFRAGTARPFRAWDHAGDRPLDLVVIPLAVMDASYDERYLGLAGPQRERHVIGVIDRIRELGGCASLLIHNDRLCNGVDDGWTELYERILCEVAEADGEVCSAGSVASKFEARSAR